MKSISNTKKKLTIVTIAIFFAVALIMAISSIMSINVDAQRDMRSSAPFDGAPSPHACASKVIKDSPEGNALGWDPDGTTTAFIIEEPCYLEFDSTVLVNIGDIFSGGNNTKVCNVDWSKNEFFEVACNSAPWDGSELRYLVLVKELDVIGATPIKHLPSDIAERKKQTNATQQ